MATEWFIWIGFGIPRTAYIKNCFSTEIFECRHFSISSSPLLLSSLFILNSSYLSKGMSGQDKIRTVLDRESRIAMNYYNDRDVPVLDAHFEFAFFSALYKNFSFVTKYTGPVTCLYVHTVIHFRHVCGELTTWVTNVISTRCYDIWVESSA